MSLCDICPCFCTEDNFDGYLCEGCDPCIEDEFDAFDYYEEEEGDENE